MNDRIFTCVIVVTSFFLYINSLFCGFVFDDVAAIVKNKDVTGESPLSRLLWNDYWGMAMSDESSHKSYRPLTVLTYRVNQIVLGMQPWMFHFVNVILNTIVCFLVFKLNLLLTKVCFETRTSQTSKLKVSRIGKKVLKQENVAEETSEKEKFISYVATLLFTVHPIHTEAVTGVVGRAELLSTIFFILSILYYAKYTVKSIILSLIFCVFAVASKEQGITVLAVCILFDIIVVHKLALDDFCLLLVTFVISPRRTKYKALLLRTFVFILFGIILLCWRFYIMQGKLPHFTSFDNPAAAASFPSRHLTYNYLLSINAGLLLNPSNLLCDWTMGTIPLIEGFSDPRNIFTILFWATYITIGSCSVFCDGPFWKLSAIAVAIATFSFIPASNLFFPVGFVVAERILFIPSIGFCLLVAMGMWLIKTKINRDWIIWVLLNMILISHCIKTVHRNMEWKSELDLFESGLKITKQNAKVWNNIGHSYEASNEWEVALNYFMKATKVQPNDVGAHMNVGRMHENLDDSKQAEIYYRKAKLLLPQPTPGAKYKARIPPSHLQVFAKIGNLIKHDESRLAEVDQLYKEAILMRPSYAEAYMNRGEILMKMNKPKEAIASYQDALKYSEDKDDLYFNIGVVYDGIGNKTGAIEAYTYAIFNNPNHTKALYNSAAIFEGTREPSLLHRAKSRVDRVLKLEPDNILAKTLLGSICMELGENNDAIKWWNEVLDVDPTQRTSLFNIALLYSKIDGKTNECIEAVNKLLSHHPKHVKGLLLYGDVMLNKMKNVEEAQRAYLRLIEADPSDVQGRHNYCVTLVEQGRLKEAEFCLTDVLVMSPQESYVEENLAIVRHRIAVIEENERKKAKQKTTNFKIKEVPEIKPEEFIPNEESCDDVKEEVIYVAQPIRRKDESMTLKAKKITDRLNNLNEEKMDVKLLEAKKAIEKLKKIKATVDLKTNEKCPPRKEDEEKETEKMKKAALKALDELEASL